MYRIVLACQGVPSNEGASRTTNISNEFANRPSHKNVKCHWDGTQLILQADNDFDSNGQTLVDEFSDAISACIDSGFDGDIQILSVTSL